MKKVNYIVFLNNASIYFKNIPEDLIHLVMYQNSWMPATYKKAIGTIVLDVKQDYKGKCTIYSKINQKNKKKFFYQIIEDIMLINPCDGEMINL